MSNFYSTKPIAVDAFCGAGGLSYGLIKAGFDVQFAFDFNERAIQTYRENLGNHAHVLDAKSVKPKKIETTGKVTLVAGGPPCQGFSVQRRGPDEDIRNDLIFEFLRLVKGFKPKIFLMENVAALASVKNKKYFDKLKDDAERLGYVVQAKVINAADFGVPQTRKRLFVLGVRKNLKAQITLPEGIDTEWKTVRDAIADLPAPRSEAARFYPNHLPDNISDLNRERISHVPPGGGRMDIPVHLRLACHSVSVDVAGHRGVYGRLDWEKPAGTITTKCNSFTRGRFAHPIENRNITMREAARLQSFPDSFAFHGGTVDVAHQVGNAVPPMLSYKIASHLLAQLVEHERFKVEALAEETE